MYIHRVVTKGVPGLPDQDLTFWDEFRQEPLHSVLITGPNGSGKTILLKVIAGLWDGFSYWLRDESARFALNMSPELARTAPEPLYEWLASYKAGTQWNTHIEAMLRNLKVRDPAWFTATLARINQYLETTGKTLTDFDGTLRLDVKIAKTGETHHLSALSSGEQQFVILIFMVNRWLMDGGVMLIDEPDLYMHVSMQRAIVRELERLVGEKHGQLIITSHAEEIWDEFNFRQSFNLLEGPRESIFHESTQAE